MLAPEQDGLQFLDAALALMLRKVGNISADLLRNTSSAQLQLHSQRASRHRTHVSVVPSFLRALLPGVANEPIATEPEPASPCVTTPPLWCNTDCGLDDTLALVLAASSTSTTMVAVSTVHGNTVSSTPAAAGQCMTRSRTSARTPVVVLQSITNVNLNVLRVLTACGKDQVPVYEGAPEPLLCKLVEHEPWDGSDGFGEAPVASTVWGQ